MAYLSLHQRKEGIYLTSEVESRSPAFWTEALSGNTFKLPVQPNSGCRNLIAADGTGNGDIVGDVAVPRGQFKPSQPHGAESKAGLRRSASMAAGLCFRCLWAGALTDAEPREGEGPERTRTTCGRCHWLGLGRAHDWRVLTDELQEHFAEVQVGVFAHAPTEHSGSGTGRAWPGCVSSLVWN